MALMAVLLAERPSRLYSNRMTRSLGEVSFSAYLVHWAVIDFLRYLGNAGYYDYNVTGIPAIVGFIPAFACVATITYAISRITYTYIEKPFIAMSRQPWLTACLVRR
jgi:peptidoglycan/LPS O-acetylase OafA/YrhL